MTLKIESIKKDSTTFYESHQLGDINCNIINLKEACFVQRFYELYEQTMHDENKTNFSNQNMKSFSKFKFP
jgi:hypothetical protein